MSSITDTINKLLGNIEQMLKRGEYRRAYICARNVLGIIKTTDSDPEITSRVLVSSARCAYYFSRFDEAHNHLNRLSTLLKINRPDCNEKIHREMILIKSNIRRRRGDYRGALECIEQCSDGVEDRDFEVNRLMITGLCLMELGRMAEAREKLEAALGLATHSGNDRGKCAVLSSLGLLSMKGGYLVNSPDYFRRALEISRRIGDIYNRGAAGLNYAISCYRLGRFDAALKGAEEALASFQECEWKAGVCRCYLALGNIQRYRENYQQALMLYRKADSIAGGNGFSRERALSAGYMGQVYSALEKFGEARSCCLSALEIINETIPRGDVALQQNRVLGRIMMKTGDFRKAEEYLEEALEIASENGAEREKGLVYWNMAELSFLSRDPEEGMRLFDNAVEAIRITGSDLDLAGVKLSYAENIYEYALKGDSKPPSGEKEAVNKLWHLLIETSHLAGGIDNPSLRENAEKLLNRVYPIRKKLAGPVEVRGGRRTYVEVGFSPEFILHQGIVSVSGLMRDVLSDVEFAATHQGPVLITGETGTGKELVARAVHDLSGRSGGNFVAVNCSAIPYRLFESEFFGHRKGCFSGAVTDRKGLFEEASGGSLFLDEIGELDPAQQAKLLRVLQEGKVRRVGENEEREIDIRLISATNRDLESKMEEGSMRKDFYFRINEEIIMVPPLRERSEDIVPLMAFCLCGNGNGNGEKLKIEKNALKFIQRYPWPGNVREFISVIRRIRRISRGGVITVDALPERIRGSKIRPDARRIINGSGRKEKKETLLRLLKSCHGNKTEVARWLGISRGTLYKELKQAGLSHLIG
ncbi:MAG: tetratricopeptide repeat protein [Candidatus Latescibacteria bacterium]|nr:tetratricopeptide repeat protein [bacterium]MBD3425171.1 tetratricopeptide repeat protein [Candidatus Latescibacterota bacterium]